MPSARITLAVAAALVAAADALAAANGWQRRLDRALLDVDRTPQARFRLLQKVLKDPAVLEDTRRAIDTIAKKGMKEGHPEAIETLWPTGTLARADLEALLALRKQVPEALEAIKPVSLSTAAASKPSPDETLRGLQQLATVATDPAKQKELVEEAKNVLRTKPKGLEAPKYSVVATLGGEAFGEAPVEIRRYEPFTVVRRKMEAVDGGEEDASFFGGSAGAQGFNSLAKYLFGDNAAEAQMSMTMPVEISAGGEASSMAFVLPRAYADEPPAPTAAEVKVERVGARLVAVRGFAGLATDGEVERQREAIGSALAADGRYRAARAGDYSVLQYNPPYTLPWRRRNEVAVVVEELGGEEAAAAGEEEAAVSSWYDAGVRLSADEPAAEQAAEEQAAEEQPAEAVASPAGVVSWYDSGVRL